MEKSFPRFCSSSGLHHRNDKFLLLAKELTYRKIIERIE